MMKAYINPKIKNFRVNYHTMMNEEEREPKFRQNALSMERAMELLAMACEDIVPNGEYSDFECNVWNMFLYVLRHEGFRI